MVYTDQDFRNLSEESYDNYEIGDTVKHDGKTFEIMEKRDDTQNGLRFMNLHQLLMKSQTRIIL